MILRVSSVLLVACLLTACPNEKKDKKKAKSGVDMKDVSGDVAFQGFVGRLRIAVERQDTATLSSLMSPDFGWRWDAPPAGETPFAYWDQQKLWGELAALMRTRWVPNEGFMVVPPQLAEDANYGGYRAGIRLVNGAWRFAYFVPAPPPEGQGPAEAAPAPTAL